MASDGRQNTSLTLTTAVLIRGQLCATPMNISLQDEAFPYPKVGEVN